MPGDIRYYFGTEPIVLDGERSDYPNTTFGQTTTFDFYLTENGNPITATGATYGGDLGATYGGDLGATYGDGGTEYVSSRERYNRLKEYGNYAGYATTNTTLGDVYYTEPADYARSEIDSLCVPIRPGDGVEEARGVWGVVTSLDDTTEIIGAQALVSVEVFVLAEYHEFDTLAEVEDEFKREI